MMRLRLIASGLLLPLTFSCAQAQTGIPPQPSINPWTVVLEGGYASGVSSSMRGTNAQFQSDVEKDYNNSTYPFGDPNAGGGDWNLGAEYRFLPGRFGVYAKGRLSGFSTNDAAGNSAYLGIETMSLGGQYIYDVSRYFDLFGKAGINGSFIGGRLSYGQWRTDITTPNFRFGLEGGLGVDWNPTSVFLLRVFADYADINVIGKSYTAPSVPPPQILTSRALNDGADPNDPADRPRTIDYLATGVAVGIRF